MKLHALPAVDSSLLHNHLLFLFRHCPPVPVAGELSKKYKTPLFTDQGCFICSCGVLVPPNLNDFHITWQKACPECGAVMNMKNVPRHEYCYGKA